MPNFVSQKVAYGSVDDYLYQPVAGANTASAPALKICPNDTSMSASTAVATWTPLANTGFTCPATGYYRVDVYMNISGSANFNGTLDYLAFGVFIQANTPPPNIPTLLIPNSVLNVYPESYGVDSSGNITGISIGSILPYKIPAGTALRVDYQNNGQFGGGNATYTGTTVTVCYTYLGNTSMV